MTLPLDLILDGEISSNAKIIYAVLKSFSKGKVKTGSAPAVTVTHREITKTSNLSGHTVVKSLTRLEQAGWIAQQRSAGSANQYIFTNPISANEPKMNF